MSRRILHWCFPGTLAVAGVLLLVLSAGLVLEAPAGDGFLARLAWVLLADPGMRTAMLAAAAGLTLTALLFFRKPRLKLPIRLRATDV